MEELQETAKTCIGVPFKEGFDPRRNLDGRPEDTTESKIIKKATKEIIAEYKEALGEALPMIKPILLAKALEGDMTAIKEIHDRVMDKSKQSTDVTSGGEKIQGNTIIFSDFSNETKS
jgi:hypothetical protein